MPKKKTITISSLTFGDLMELTDLQNRMADQEQEAGLETVTALFKFLDRIIDGGIKDHDLGDYEEIMEAVTSAFNEKFSALTGGDEKN